MIIEKHKVMWVSKQDRDDELVIVCEHVKIESNEVRIIQKQEQKEEALTEEMKRSPDERHTQTHGSLTETF